MAAEVKKHYGALRSTQTAAEIASRLRPQTHENSALVRGGDKKLQSCLLRSLSS